MMIQKQSGFCGKDGGCGLNYASDIKEAAYVASLAAAIPKMQQIATRTGHPMSQDLANFDSDHPVMKALRTTRDWLTQQLGGEPPDNHTVPTNSENHHHKQHISYKASEDPILKTQRSPTQHMVRTGTNST